MTAVAPNAQVAMRSAQLVLAQHMVAARIARSAPATNGTPSTQRSPAPRRRHLWCNGQLRWQPMQTHYYYYYDDDDNYYYYYHYVWARKLKRTPTAQSMEL